jgi:hypothetical protein
MSTFKIFFPSGYDVNDIENDNIDVNVILPDGAVFFATFFTIQNIERIMNNEKGLFFWSTDMVILKDLKENTINNTIEKIIQDGYLELIFSKIGSVESVYSGYKSFDDF